MAWKVSGHTCQLILLASIAALLRSLESVSIIVSNLNSPSIMKTRILIFAIFSVVLVACQPEIDEFQASKGNADFTKYVAIGNSLTSGYADAALYHSAQANSYPAIMAAQFAKVGGGNFIQPVVNSEYGVLSGKRVLDFAADCKGVVGLSPVPATGSPEGLAHVGYAVNNFGVPGAKSYHLLAQNYGNPAGLVTTPMTANPYFVRFASSPSISVMEDVMAAQGTFFSLWVGNNDILGYATAGGENTQGDSITPVNFFSVIYNGLVSTLTSTGAKGVLANIPDITEIPFFTTVTYNGLVLTAEQAVQLNGAYAQVEAYLASIGVPYQYNFNFQAGANAFVIEDRNFPIAALPKALKVRQIQPGELILLTVPQDSMKCYGMGSFSTAALMPFGIPQNYVLDAQEVAIINNATAAYNVVIKAAAESKGLALADMNSHLRNLKSGLIYDGLTFTTTFVTGGVFSLDGVHLNQQGAAVVANFFIDAINKTYSASVPKAEVTQYPGILFP
ncbi:MAG: hypothetical protein CVU06_00855 [Bacteroidetes bacterium HGW-Bacteroidetes-22]|nr:MAG: hypothetical protein CVU06_00855 [Bacteroidetes bacterium HGW-Bacteroidetes-22]